MPEGRKRSAQESRLWLALGVSLQATAGYAASEVGAAYERARELSESTGDTPLFVSAIRGHSIFSIVRADYASAFSLGERLAQVRDHSGGYDAERLMILGLSSLYTGALEAGEHYFLEAISSREAEGPLDMIQYSGHARALCLSYLALDTWYLGYPARSLQYSGDGVALARTLAIPITMAQATAMYGTLSLQQHEFAVAEEYMDQTILYATEHGFLYWRTLGLMLKGWLVASRSGDGAGFAQFEEHLGRYRAIGAKIGLPWFLVLRAEVFIARGNPEEALRSLDEALAAIEETNERLREAEIHRLRGEVLLLRDGAGASDAAQSCFRRSLDVARHQAARSLELRTTMSMARLCATHGRPQQGLDILGPILSWFEAEHDAPDLRDARMLRDELARAAGAPCPRPANRHKPEARHAAGS